MRFRTPGAPRRADVPSGPQRVAAGGFAAAVLGAAGFVVAYLTDAGVAWQGVAVAAALAGLSLGFAAWSRLLPEGPYVEEREPMSGAPQQREVFGYDLGRADGHLVSAPLPRRMLTAALAAGGIAFAVPLRSLFRVSQDPVRTLTTTAWTDGTPMVRSDGTRVHPDDLEHGSALTVYPQGHTDQDRAGVLLVRVDPRELELPGDRMAWTVDGIVAYSKICTHAGCPVGLFVQGSGELLCPCHQSVFDVYRGARPRYGPAARALPQLPMATGPDGTLVARGDFPVPPGPGFWRQQ